MWDSDDELADIAVPDTEPKPIPEIDDFRELHANIALITMLLNLDERGLARYYRDRDRVGDEEDDEDEEDDDEDGDGQENDDEEEDGDDRENDDEDGDGDDEEELEYNQYNGDRCMIFKFAGA